MAKRGRPSTRSKAKKDLVNGGLAEKVKDYRHEEKRPNNPPAGLATYDKTAPSRKLYSYDPHLDPQLVWAGKAERLSFEVENVALHIHERISTAAIIRAVQREEPQRELFADPQLPLTQQIEFYQHPMDWANRLILGDSLLVMNSLLERELMTGKAQMIYFDPPYGVNYKSNFQPGLRKPDPSVQDKDENLTREPEQIKAYRDTWVLGVHSYLTYLRDRLVLCRELLAQTGSIFLQISDDNLHHARELLDEVFGANNFVQLVAFKKKKMPLRETFMAGVADYLLWYARDRDAAQEKFHRLFGETPCGEDSDFNYVELPNGKRISVAEVLKVQGEIPPGARYFQSMDLRSSGRTESCIFPFEFKGRTFTPGGGKSWKTNKEGMERLREARRLFAPKDTLRYVLYHDDYPVSELTHMWMDTQGAQDMRYVVETATKIIQRCLLMTTDPGDLVFDPTCGSGTTALVAEQWGRRWITCDTSRVAIALARQRLLTATFPYFRLAYPARGVSGGFTCESAPHVTLGSIAQCEPSQPVTLYDRPMVDTSKVRVSGPLTVEAIPVPASTSPDDALVSGLQTNVRQDAMDSRAHGEGPIINPASDHITTMIELLRKAGLNFPGGKKLMLENLRPLEVGWLHAEAEAKQNGSKTLRVAVSFGPRHGPINSVQTEEAARTAAVNGYDLLVLAGFAVDPEAQAFIQKHPLKLTIHFANVNPDVLVGDLLKTSRASQLFTVFGSPDVKLERHKDGSLIVHLLGVDVYNPNTGDLQQSRGQDVAAWFIDQDYDGHTFCVSQAFFPADSDAWEKLEHALKGKLNTERFESLVGEISLPFSPGRNRRIAVKVIDMRGNETIRVLQLDDLH